MRTGRPTSPRCTTDPEDARWLEASIPPDLVEGDVLAALPNVLSTLPEEWELVVFSTHVPYQLEDETVAELRSLLAEHAAEPTVRWLSNDPSEELDELTCRLLTFDGGAIETRLAEFESDVEWLRWLAA